MGCTSCGRSNLADAKFCSNCGITLAKEPLSKAAPARAGASFDLAEFEAELAKPKRSSFKWALGAALLVLVVSGSLLLTRWERGDRIAARLPEIAATPAGQTAIEPAPWNPPPGRRESIEALGRAFPSLDERDLGALFDAELKPLYGAPSLFESSKPQRIRRNEMNHSLVRLTDGTQFDAGFRVLLMQMGKRWSAIHEYSLYRASQLVEIVRVDENQPMRQPPEQAVFYLAEVHTGASYEVMIEAFTKTQGGGSIALELSNVGGSFEELRRTGKYSVDFQGTGLMPRHDSAIFATTPDEIAAAYTSSAQPVPISLVFRTIPGRTFQRKKLPAPRVIVEEQFQLAEGQEKRFWIAAAGSYQVTVTSVPKGVVLSWNKHVECEAPNDGRETPRIQTQCEAPKRTDLILTNWTQRYTGPVETVAVRVVKLPAPP